MAAPAFVGAGSGNVWTTGAAVAVTKTGVTVGNLIILHAYVDAGDTVTLSAISGVENLAGTDNAVDGPISGGQVGATALGAHAIYIGRAISTTVSISMAGTAPDCYARIYEFSNVNTGTTQAAVLEAVAEAHGTGTTVSDVGVTTLGVDRLALNFVAINDDASGLAAFAGETGGDWTLAVSIYETSTGSDATIGLMRATMASAGTINGGSDAITSLGWGVIGCALIGTTPSSTPKSDTDTGSGTDDGSVAFPEFSGTDTGTSTEDLAISVSDSDTGTSIENAAVVIPVSDSDTGAGSDAEILAAQYAQEDTGVGADASTLAAVNTASDTGSSTEDASVTVPISGNDTGSSSDTATAVAQYTQSDTGAGSDASVVLYAITGTDSGAATENSAISLTFSETGTGADEVSQFTRAVFETGSGLEESILSAGNAKSGSDSGTGVDDSTLTVTSTGGDTGTGLDDSTIWLTFFDTGAGIEVISTSRTVNDFAGAVEAGGIGFFVEDAGSGSEIAETAEFSGYLPEFTYSRMSSAGVVKSTLVGAAQPEKSQLASARKASRMTKAT